MKGNFDQCLDWLLVHEGGFEITRTIQAASPTRASQGAFMANGWPIQWTSMPRSPKR